MAGNKNLNHKGHEGTSRSQIFSQVLSGGLGFAAIFANPVNLKGMTSSGVVMSAAYFLLQLIHFVREKLHRTATFRANHVVMAAAVLLVLVTGNAIVENDFAGLSSLCPPLGGAINGGVTQFCVFFFLQAVQIL